MDTTSRNHSHRNGDGVCWTPSLCAAREAIAKLRKLAADQGDSEMAKLVERIASSLPLDN